MSKTPIFDPNDPNQFPTRLRNCLEGKAGKLRKRVQYNIFAKEIKLNKSSISDYLSGFSKMSYENLCKTADYFGVTVDYLVGHGDVPLPDPDLLALSISTGLSDKSIEVLKSFKE